jgi:hypothetical protein
MAKWIFLFSKSSLLAQGASEYNTWLVLLCSVGNRDLRPALVPLAVQEPRKQIWVGVVVCVSVLVYCVGQGKGLVVSSV